MIYAQRKRFRPLFFLYFAILLKIENDYKRKKEDSTND